MSNDLTYIPASHESATRHLIVNLPDTHGEESGCRSTLNPATVETDIEGSPLGLVGTANPPRDEAMFTVEQEAIAVENSDGSISITVGEGRPA